MLLLEQRELYIFMNQKRHTFEPETGFLGIPRGAIEGFMYNWQGFWFKSWFSREAATENEIEREQRSLKKTSQEKEGYEASIYRPFCLW